MIYIRDGLAAVALFAVLFIGVRYADISNAAIDWSILGLCSVSPLVDPKIRKKNFYAIATLFLVNAIVMFFIAFWIMSIVFGEGL